MKQSCKESSVVETNWQRVIVGRPDGPLAVGIEMPTRHCGYRCFVYMAAAAPSHAQPLRACGAYIGLAGRDVAGLASSPTLSVVCSNVRKSAPDRSHQYPSSSPPHSLLPLSEDAQLPVWGQEIVFVVAPPPSSPPLCLCLADIILETPVFALLPLPLGAFFLLFSSSLSLFLSSPFSSPFSFFSLFFFSF